MPATHSDRKSPLRHSPSFPRHPQQPTSFDIRFDLLSNSTPYTRTQSTRRQETVVQATTIFLSITFVFIKIDTRPGWLGRESRVRVSRSVIIIPSSRHDTLSLSLSLMRSGIRREFSICVTLAVGVCLYMFVHIYNTGHILKGWATHKRPSLVFIRAELWENGGWRVVEKKEVYPFTGAYVHTRERGLVHTHTHTLLYTGHMAVLNWSRRLSKPSQLLA